MISQEKIDEIADTITSKIRYRIRDESWLNVYPPIAPLVTLEEARKEDESIGITFREEEFQKLNGGRKI